MKIYNEAYHTVNHGQFLDIVMEKKDMATEEDYLEMIEKKTACLFEASISIGALLADAGQDQIRNLANYAKEMAIAFQLTDDIMDISEDMSKGHALGSDIKSGKKTLLIIKALENGTEKEKKDLKQILGTNTAEEKIKRAIEIINRNSLDYVKEEANRRIKKAKDILKQLDIKKDSKNFFNEFADHMVARRK